MSFKNKVVIVTGAGSGIGKTISLTLNTEGAKVVLVGRNVDNLYAVAANCNDTLVIQADITQDEDCKKIINNTIKHYNQLDILINNAGTIPTGTLFDGNILQAYDITMKEKVRAVVHLTTLAIPHLMKTKGNIVNISGVGARIVPLVSDIIMFNTAEAAMDHFSKCAAAELAPFGIRVNVVTPGPTNTTILDNSDTTLTFEEVIKQTPLGRLSEPQEIADFILFVASDKAKSITGANYAIDNGFTLR